MSGLGERTVIINGQPCRVWEKGTGSPLGFLAGIAGLPRWTPFLDRLAGGHRVIVPSLPGFPGGLGHDQLDSQLDWIAATLDLLEAAGLAGADLIGASLGGALAAEAAALAPGFVRRLVLIAPFGLYDEAAPPTDIWAQRPGALPGLLCRRAATYESFVAPPEGADAAEWSIAMVRASEAAARLLWPLGDTRLARRLHRIRCPALVAWGDEDRVLSPNYAERFARALGGEAAIALVPGAGHLAELDAPDLAADMVMGFLAAGAAPAR